MRNAGRELTEEEEAKLPGCSWAVNHQLAGYCFFKLIEEYSPDIRELSDTEIAHYCSVSTDTVRKAEKHAIGKIKRSRAFQEIADEYGSDKVIPDAD